MKFMAVVGARPQFMKCAMLSAILRTQAREVQVHTGQHYDKNMSDTFFKELNIPKPDYNLNIGSGGHGYQTGRMLVELEQLMQHEEPDCVIVYGDTNTTLAGALSASKLHIPVAHIEAGLRSFNMAMAEEQNRIITDHISSLLFAPCLSAYKNLTDEKVRGCIYCVGDLMYDAVLCYYSISWERSTVLNRLGVMSGSYILATIHRAENTDNPYKLREIIRALSSVNYRIILPLHPRTRKCIEEYGMELGKCITVIEPVGYIDMLSLEGSAKKIITDSGGVQKEAFFLRVPCITVRNETEWVETLENGWNILTGCDEKKIACAIECEQGNAAQKKPYGSGNAAEQIVRILTAHVKEVKKSNGEDMLPSG